MAHAYYESNTGSAANARGDCCVWSPLALVFGQGPFGETLRDMVMPQPDWLQTGLQERENSMITLEYQLSCSTRWNQSRLALLAAMHQAINALSSIVVAKRVGGEAVLSRDVELD